MCLILNLDFIHLDYSLKRTSNNMVFPQEQVQIRNKIFLNLVHLLSFAIQFISTPPQPDLTIWLIKNLLKSKAEMLNKHTLQFG